MNSHRFLLTGFIILALAASLWPATLYGAPTPEPLDGSTPTVAVRLTPQAYAAAPDLAPMWAVNYGSFVWLEIPADQLPILKASGLPYEQAETAIGISGYTFDPLQSEPNIPSTLHANATGNEPGLFLVQFIAPVSNAWLNDLRTLGLTPLQYYPHNAYLVWGTPAQVKSLESKSYRRWSGIFQPAYKLNPYLSNLEGEIENIAVMFYNDGAVDRTLGELKRLGSYVQHFPAQPDGAFYVAIMTLDASRLADVAHMSTVWALDYVSPRPGFDDENADQIVAGNYPGGTPVVGYYNWLAAKGIDGSGITWADVDTGLNSGHPDVTGRASAFISYAGCGQANQDVDGHGSHTAGAIFGDARASEGGTGITDPNGFYWGTGMAPKANLVVQNALAGACTLWPPSGGWQQLSKDTVLNNAIGSSNSWNTGLGHQGYSIAARTHDIMVRDANFDTSAVAEPIIMVFSAGNSGPGGNSITDPKEDKNLITVGASDNYPRSGSSVNGLASYSSRGPADDGRLLPNVTAPGENTVSFNGNGANCGSPVAGPGAAYYNYCGGTSMACPMVAGASALIADWWAQEGRGTPSPAMVKALLINGAADMVGGSGINGNIPNTNQGWGRVNLNNVISTGVPSLYFDQDTLLTGAGETWQQTFYVANPGQPLKISLVWTDVPGAVNANPTLVNNLDLTVVNSGQTYYGNHFSNGWSTPGGSADTLNNIENIYVQNPNGAVQVTVSAANIPGDGVPYNEYPTDQDFALVCYNCLFQPDFELTASPTQLELCTPGAITYTIQVNQVLTYPYPVTLEAGLAPQGITALLAPTVVTPTGQAALTLGGTLSATVGSYEQVITGTAQVTNVHVLGVPYRVNTRPTGVPALVSPGDGAIVETLAPTLRWDALGLAASYEVEVARDLGFTDVVVSATGVLTTNYTLPGALEPLSRYYWRVRGENTCGQSEYSPVWEFDTPEWPCVLLVDDDGGKSAEVSYQAALGGLHTEYHVYTVPSAVANGPEASELIQYPIVIWLTGDRYINTLTGSDQAALSTYLNGGGKLFLSSWGVGGELNNSSFLANYLHADYTGDGPWGRTEVVTGTGFLAGQTVTLTIPVAQPASKLTPEGGAETVYSLRAPYGSTGVAYQAGYGVVYFGFGLEWIEGEASRQGVLEAVLNWLGPCAVPVAVEPSFVSSSPDLIGAVTVLTNTTITGTQPISYMWRFGDSTPVMLQPAGQMTVTHAYTQVGQYTVWLTATNKAGTVAVSGTVAITGTLPHAGFVSSSPVEVGQALAFTNTTVLGAPAQTSYQWSFGDGAGYSTETSPVYTYTQVGTYTVWLTATNLAGGDVFSDTVRVVLPIHRVFLPIVLK